MKKLFTLSLLSVSSIYGASISASEITNMITQIRKERVGIDLKQLNNTKNPFIVNKIEEKKEEVKKKVVKAKKAVVVEKVYKLDAILNHAAFINKKWYKRGDKIDQYVVQSLSKSSVVLKSKSGVKKTLSMKKKKNIIQSNQGN